MKNAGDASIIASLTVYGVIFEKMKTVDLRALSKINVGDLSNNITNDILRVIICIYTCLLYTSPSPRD